jgi:hypothetical protein
MQNNNYADYKISWEINIIATSPQDAADKALKILRTCGNEARFFNVTDVTDINGNTQFIEANEP